MISKTLKTRKKKLATKKTAPEAVEKQTPSVVLAGTYKDKQLDFIEREGFYNYPIGENDKLKSEDASQVKELWLYAGRTKVERKVFAAEFVGIQTREKFLAAHPKYPKGSKSKHTRYLVFKVEKLDYGTRLENPLVFARAADFTSGKSAKIAAAIKQFEKDGDFASLADYLPEDLGTVPRKQLRVCEAAVQLDFVFVYQPNNETQRTKSNLRLISLFSGAGGLDVGFRQAGFETAVMVEFDPACCRTLRKNMPTTPVIEGDINQVPTPQILSAAGLKPLEAALVIGGPPCQSFSLAGKRMGLDDPRGRLVLEFIRVVREALPAGFVMENVRGLTNWENGRALDAIINEATQPIEYKGRTYTYQVSVKILNAADHGAPQFRERVFIVGNRLQKDFVFPEKKFGPPGNNQGLCPYVTVRDAICGLPPALPPSDVALRVSGTIKDRIKKHGY